MRIVHLSYARVMDYNDPRDFLKRIDFFVALLEEMGREAEISSIHCINYSGVLDTGGIQFHFLKRTRLQLLIPIGTHNYLKRLAPEVVVVHGVQFIWQVLWLRFQLGSKVKILVQHHSEKPFGYFKGKFLRFVDRFVSAYFFPSIEQARPWVDQKQIRHLDKVSEIMEVPSVFYPIDKREARSRTGVTGEKIYLWVGRLDENKDPVTLVHAFLKFAETNRDVVLYVVYQQDTLLDEIKTLLQVSPDEAGQIKLIGKVEHRELLYWFNSADFIISTSHYEGMGISVCEAMSCGCIPILSNIPSFAAMTSNGECGLLFSAGNCRDLQAALSKSSRMDITTARDAVLGQYKKYLSAEAISGHMIQAIRNIKNLQN